MLTNIPKEKKAQKMNVYAKFCTILLAIDVETVLLPNKSRVDQMLPRFFGQNQNCPDALM